MFRLDRIDAPLWLTDRFEKTPEGYLKGRAAVCSTGVYQYMDGEGKIYGELRLPEEVFKEEFLESLKLIPLTLLHPDEFVTAENVKKYQVGTLGSRAMDDQYHISMDMVVHDAEAIKAIEAGTRELSVGYSCDLENASGVWCGMKYDRIQRNLKANHVSVVPAARGGDALRIRLDSAGDAVLVRNSEKEATMPELKTVKLDGVDYQAEARVLEALHNATNKVDTMQNDLTTKQASLDTAAAEKTVLEAERDTLKDRCDGLEKKVAELEKSRMDEAALKAAVDRRVKILDAAKLAGVEVKDGMNELDIQKAIIVAVFPKANLDGKDQTYIDARFDGAMESIELRADAETRQAGAPEVQNTDAVTVEPSASAAQAKYVESLKNGYKVKEA